MATLRAFRDYYLLSSHLGCALVASYYWLSPPVADVVAASGVVRWTVRCALWPFVLTARAFLTSPILGCLVIVGSFAAARLGVRVTKRLARGG